MDTITKLRAWTYRRQLLEEGADSLPVALAHIVGVYSSHPSAPLSLWARTKNFTPDAFRALEQDKAAVRIPAWRGSIFLLAQAEARLAMTFRAPIKLGAAWYKYAGITEADLPVIREKLLAGATTPMLPKELRAATGLQAQGIASIARHAAYEGKVLRIGATSLRANSLRYVSTEAWLPDLLTPVEPAEAWREVARRYFAAYGPARIEDFRWWLGTTKNLATEVVAQLDTTEVAEGLLLLTEDVDAYHHTTPLPEDAVAIVPKWDSYTMGLAGDGRARLIDPSMQSRGYTSVGDGLGLVLVGGKAVATWHHNFSGSKMSVELDIFDARAHAVMDTIRAKMDAIARVLDGKSCEITLATEPLAPRLSVLRVRHGTLEE